MTRDECSKLVNLIVSTWPAGPKGYVWTEALGDLDVARATVTYRALRDVEERPVSVAKFLTAYRVALGGQPAGEPLSNHHQPCECPACRRTRPHLEPVE